MMVIGGRLDTKAVRQAKNKQTIPWDIINKTPQQENTGRQGNKMQVTNIFWHRSSRHAHKPLIVVKYCSNRDKCNQNQFKQQQLQNRTQSKIVASFFSFFKSASTIIYNKPYLRAASLAIKAVKL